MQDKTETPTHRRLEETRKEGRVARSQELNAAAALLVGIWLLTGPGSKLFGDIWLILQESLTSLPQSDLSNAMLSEVITSNLLKITAGMATILLGMLITGVSVTMAQTGFLWSQKKIGFDFSRIDPLKGFKKFFSTQALIEWAKALLKLIIIGWVAYSFLRGQVNNLLLLGQLEFKAAISEWGHIAISLAFRIGVAFAFLAAADYGYQYMTFKKSLMMTKQEVREDMRRSEGDPKLKNRIRSQQRRMARFRMMANVHKADVVITNPTHLAIAIRYDQNSMNAPVVLAKGAYLIAERIVALARSNNIPVIQNIPLARAIYKTVEIEQEIPSLLYVAMAEVLAHVYSLRGKLPQPVRN
jgi:flagellar biosynthetic protein FlhB